MRIVAFSDVHGNTPALAVLDGSDGAWQVREHAVMYDIDAAVAFAESNGRHDVAYALRTDRNR